jgi:hypothetical protein
MAITINWATKVIDVPQSDLTFLGGDDYELDITDFHWTLRDIEDDVGGMVHLPTHTHNTEVILSGDTFARVVQIINGYTVTFEDTGSPYRVFLVGANSNILDVANLNNVSIAAKNSGGLVIQPDGVTAANVWEHLGEGALTMEVMMRVMLSALAGTTTGLGTDTEKYESVDGLKDRITVTFDANSNRTTIVLDGSI